MFAAMAVLGAIGGDFSVGIGLMAFAGLIALAGVLTSRRPAR